MLAENDTAAGRLWDIERRGTQTRRLPADRALWRFLNQQPELLQLAEQLGVQGKRNPCRRKMRRSETFRSPVREPATVPEQVDGLQQSDDILRLLPPELATLGITELELNFIASW